MLLSHHAAQKAEAVGNIATARVLYGTSRGADSLPGDQLRLDSVDELLWSSKNEQKLFQEAGAEAYQGLEYLTLFSSVVGLDNRDEPEKAKIAQRLLLYQMGKTASAYIKSSPLETLYRRVGRAVKRLSDRTTLQVVREREGGVVFAGGEDRALSLFELKLHFSAREGVEPRLKLSEHVVFRYDVFGGAALLELSRQF